MNPNENAGEKMKPQYGWYSERMAQIAGTVVWANETGRSFTLTCVSDSANHGTRWDDIQFRAMVSSFVCRSRRATLDLIIEHFIL